MPRNVPFAALAEEIRVIPSIRVKRIRDERRAEQELDLAARHALAHLIQIVHLDDVALLHVHAIRAAAGSENRERRAQHGKRRSRLRSACSARFCGPVES